MVFIVKIPSRGGGAASSGDASSSADDAAVEPRARPSPAPSGPASAPQGLAPEQPQPAAAIKDEDEAPPLAAFDGLSLLAEAAAAGASNLDIPSAIPLKQEPEAATPPTLSAPAPSVPPAASSALDVIVAPAVLEHRFVRSTDTSMIVERPERIRAVVLGLAALLGRVQAGDAVVRGGGVEATTDSVKREGGHGSLDAGDDSLDALTGQLAGMSMERGGAKPESGDINVLISKRALPLSSADAALSMAHAHPDERLDDVETLLSAYAKRKGGTAKQEGEHGRPASYGVLDYIEYLARLCADSPAQPPPPRPKTLRTPRGGKRSTAQTPVKPPPTPAPPLPGSDVSATPAPSEPMSEAPSTPKTNAVSDPMLRAEVSTPKPAAEPPTPAEDEGEDHPSEIPEHMPQGDLYLAGPDGSGQGASKAALLLSSGSGQAISHALGAVCLAVDRIVAGSASPGVKGEADADVTHLLASSPATSSEFSAPSPRAFVLTRPPGHHCSATVPSGFCWVNNAIVAACHAYHAHGIDRVVILDIDLHHGNGTQSLAWRINAETAASDLARDAQLQALQSAALEKRRLAMRGGTRSKAAKSAAAVAAEEAEPSLDELAEANGVKRRGLRIFYGSLHDIESFPCEDGNPDLVRDASTVVEGAHGQWIVNVHLETAETPSAFDRLYAYKYSRLLSSASSFLSSTSSRPSSTLILISAGFDANSLEYSSMQRHGKSVPPIFYERFGREARLLAEATAGGKVLSVLEGGYSDRALCSGAMAHLSGLAGVKATSGAAQGAAEGALQAKRMGGEWEHEVALAEWWTPENLTALEALAKRVDKALPTATQHQSSQTPLGTPSAAAASGAGGSGKRRGPDPYKGQPWLAATAESFSALQLACARR